MYPERSDDEHVAWQIRYNICNYILYKYPVCVYKDGIILNNITRNTVQISIIYYQYTRILSAYSIYTKVLSKPLRVSTFFRCQSFCIWIHSFGEQQNTGTLGATLIDVAPWRVNLFLYSDKLVRLYSKFWFVLSTIPVGVFKGYFLVVSYFGKNLNVVLSTSSSL